MEVKMHEIAVGTKVEATLNGVVLWSDCELTVSGLVGRQKKKTRSNGRRSGSF